MKSSKTPPTSTESDAPETSDDGIRIENLDVTAGKRPLLVDASAHFRNGEISLIVGPSGVGKSVLLRIVASLLESREEGIRYQGRVTVDGKPSRPGDVGVVFQSFALFDEMSPLENVRFAKDQAGRQANPTPPRELLEQLRVPRNVPSSRLSGGQRQRLAIARTLAYNPKAIMFDEPTSGLDPVTARQVADLISSTHAKFGKTSVIVTHDYLSLMPIADRIFLLDPVAKGLVEVPRDEWDTLSATLEPMSRANISEEESESFESWPSRLQGLVTQAMIRTTGIAEAFLLAALSLIPIWRSPKWGGRHFWHYMRLIAGPTAWLYLIVAGLVTGFVTTYFTFQFLPYSSYTEPLLIEDLLTALGFATYRLFVPVLATILIAARCGAAVASDVGGRQFSYQIDAMKSLGANPRNYLFTPIIFSFLIGTPFLNYIAYWVARTTSLITFSFSRPEHGPQFWDYHYNRALELINRSTYFGFSWLVSKLLVCAIGIALVSYFQGRRPKYSTTDVSRAVTATILWATLWVLIVHFGFSFYEFNGTIPGSRSAQM